jgi:hypothetical protein
MAGGYAAKAATASAIATIIAASLDVFICSFKKFLPPAPVAGMLKKRK